MRTAIHFLTFTYAFVVLSCAAVFVTDVFNFADLPDWVVRYVSYTFIACLPTGFLLILPAYMISEHGYD